MATDLQNEQPQSVTTLVSGILDDVRDLVAQQFDLFKHEIRDDARKLMVAVVLMIVGSVVGLVSLLLLGLTLAHVLQYNFPALPLWACFGISGCVFLVGSSVLIGVAVYMARSAVPEQSAAALKENVQWLTKPK